MKCLNYLLVLHMNQQLVKGTLNKIRQSTETKPCYKALSPVFIHLFKQLSLHWDLVSDILRTEDRLQIQPG